MSRVCNLGQTQVNLGSGVAKLELINCKLVPDSQRTYQLIVSYQFSADKTTEAQNQQEQFGLQIIQIAR